MTDNAASNAVSRKLGYQPNGLARGLVGPGLSRSRQGW
jgi:RimJ/RimL family protein N-acetyltransferase